MKKKERKKESTQGLFKSISIYNVSYYSMFKPMKQSREIALWLFGLESFGFCIYIITPLHSSGVCFNFLFDHVYYIYGHCVLHIKKQAILLG
jgi:hypothetical protein